MKRYVHDKVLHTVGVSLLPVDGKRQTSTARSDTEDIHQAWRILSLVRCRLWRDHWLVRRKSFIIHIYRAWGGWIWTRFCRSYPSNIPDIRLLVPKVNIDRKILQTNFVHNYIRSILKGSAVLFICKYRNQNWAWKFATLIRFHRQVGWSY